MVLRSECLEALPPGLLQDHSSSGELHYTALVKTLRGSGELLVNCSNASPRHHSAHDEAGGAKEAKR